MTTIIKNQIVKQLARFTKNLSPSKISLKFLKGEGELRNLELNEAFLADLLELPPFIRLTKAVCNKISAKIHWTRLKTDPIRLFLDCVEVEMEMKETITDREVVQLNSKHPVQANQTNREKPSEYGFVEKVVDGMLVEINSVVMAFRTSTFRATFQMSHLSIHSTDPNWEKANLRSTRIKDEAGKEVLTFKQITFGTMRVDADALYKIGEEQESSSSSPLRLITSSAKINIVIKKKIEDCSVVSARLHVILDDVLWVLTHAQLQAVAGFAKSVVQVVEKCKKCEPAPSVASDDSFNSSNINPDNLNERSPSAEHPKQNPTSLFQREDVKETSYRVTTGKIDLHLCDDTPIEKSFMDGNEQTGGSMQILVNKLSFEHYPYHLAFTSRVHWASHNEASLTRAQWVQELFSFYKKVMKKDEKKTRNKGSVSLKSDVSANNANIPRPAQDSKEKKISVDHDPRSKKRSRMYLYECAFVISCDEFIVMPVATNEKKSTVNIPFLCSDKKSLYLPSDMPALQFDYTLYFFPGQENAKVPQPNLFCQLNPLHLTMDDVTCIWFHRFVQSIRSGFVWAEELMAAQEVDPRHIDVRIEGLMPKLTLPCPSQTDSYYKEFRPQALQVQMSSFRASNTRIGSEFKQGDLVSTLETFLESNLYTQNEMFPNDVRDVSPLPQFAWLNDFSICSGVETIELFLNGVQEDYTGVAASAVWMLNARQCWCDFIGVDEANCRPTPFVEPFPLRLCLCYPILSPSRPLPVAQTANQSSTDVHGQAENRNVNVQYNNQPSADTHSQAETHKSSTSVGYLSTTDVLRLHRTPSDPYCKQPQRYGRNSSASTTTTPLSSPGFAKVHKSRSAASVNIPVLASDIPNVHGAILKPSSSLSLSASQSGSEDESCDSFFEDTGSESAQSIPSRTNSMKELVGKRLSYESPIYRTTPVVRNSSDTDSMSDSSAELKSHLNNSVLRDSDRSYNKTSTKCGLSVLLDIPSVVAVKLDHFQFVFLMRLQESFVTLRDVLYADLEKFETQRRKLCEKDCVLSEETYSEDRGIVISLVSKGAEVSLHVPAPTGEEPETKLEKETAEELNDVDTKSGTNFRAQSLREGGLSEEFGVENVDVKVWQTKHINEKNNSGISENPSKELTSVEDSWTVVEQDRSFRIQEDSAEGRPVKRPPHECSVSDTSSTQTSKFGSEFSLQTGGSMAIEQSYRGRDVSTVTIRGNSLECLVAMSEDDFACKLIAGGCDLVEGSQQNLEAFYTQKVGKEAKQAPNDSGKCGKISLRYALGSTVDQTLDGAVEKGVAHVEVSNVLASILMSNLDGVLECIQDELVFPPPFLPVVVDIRDLNITLNGNTPPRLLSIPPSVPTTLRVDRARVKRTANGEFEVKVDPKPSNTYPEQLYHTTDGLSVDNKEMVERLGAENSKMASRLNSVRKENLRLMKELEISREARESLENERDRLLVTVKRLTDELVNSNREHDELLRQVRRK